MPLIALDNGHGLYTPGKRTPIFTDGTRSPVTGENFMHEWEFNRRVVELLKPILERCKFQVLEVSPTEDDIDLAVRCKVANDAKADFFLSVHANAATGVWGSAHGIETYAWTSGASLTVGKYLQSRLIAATGLTDRGVKDGTWLAVLKDTNMSAALVECGFMDNPDEAKLLLSEDYRKTVAVALAKGLCDGFGMTYVEESQPTPVPVPQPTPAPVPSGKTPIMGESVATLGQLVAFIQRVNPSFDPEIARIFLEVGKLYGTRGDIAVCQAVDETDWFRFTGDAKPEQNNFCGMGTFGGSPGYSFTSIRDGVTAQNQHLLAYGSTLPLPKFEILIDPRFDKVSPRGKAPCWEDLGGKWAVPGYNPKSFGSFDEAYQAGATYGQVIMHLYAEVLNTPEPAPVPQPAPTGFSLSVADADKIIDTFITPVWNFCSSEGDKSELHRLANELRKASGQPMQD